MFWPASFSNWLRPRRAASSFPDPLAQLLPLTVQRLEERRVLSAVLISDPLDTNAVIEVTDDDVVSITYDDVTQIITITDTDGLTSDIELDAAVLTSLTIQLGTGNQQVIWTGAAPIPVAALIIESDGGLDDVWFQQDVFAAAGGIVIDVTGDLVISAGVDVSSTAGDIVILAGQAIEMELGSSLTATNFTIDLSTTGVMTLRSLDADAIHLRFQGGGDYELVYDDVADLWVLSRDGTDLISYELTAATTLYVTGAVDSSDSLTIDFINGNPIVEGGVFFDGLGGTGDDTLFLMGGTHTDTIYTYFNASSGTIDLDGSLVTFAGLEPIVNSGTTVNAVFNLPVATADAITLSDLGGGFLELDGSTIETTAFTTPTGSLTINGQADDSVTLGGVNLIDLADAGLTILDVGDVHVLQSVTLGSFTTDAAGDFTLGAGVTILAGSAVSITQEGVVTLHGAISGESISIVSGSNAANAIEAADAATFLQATAGGITLTAAAGGIDFALGTLEADGGDIELVAGDAVSVLQVTTLTSGDFTSTGTTFTLVAGGAIDVVDDVTVSHSGQISLHSGIAADAVELTTTDNSADAIVAADASVIVEARDGAIELNATNGGVDFTLGALAATNGAILITAAAAVAVNQVQTTGSGNFESKGSSFTLVVGGEIVAADAVEIEHTGEVTLHEAITGESISITTTASGADAIQAATGNAVLTTTAGDIVLDASADGGVNFALGTLDANGGSIRIDADGDVSLFVATATGGGLESSAGGDFELVASGGIEVTGNVTIQHAGTIAVHSEIRGDELSLESDANTADAILGTANLVSQSGITLTTITAGGGVDFTAGNLSAVNGDIVINAQGDVIVSTVTTTDGGGFESIGTGTFDLVSGGMIEVAEAIVINHDGAITLAASLSGDSVSITTTETTANAIASSGAIDIQAATGAIELTSGGGIDVGSAELNSLTDDVILQGGNTANDHVVVGVVIAGNDFTVTNGGDFSIAVDGGLDITNNATIDANGSVTLSETVEIGGDLESTGAGTLTIVNGATVEVDGAATFVRDGLVTIAGAFGVGGLFSSGGADGFTLATTGQLAADSIALTHDGAVSLQSEIEIDGSFSSTGAGTFTLAAGTGLSADTSITLDHGDTVSLNADVETLGTFQSTGNGDFQQAAGTILDAGTTITLTGNGDVELNGAVLAGGGFSSSGNGLFTLGTGAILEADGVDLLHNDDVEIAGVVTSSGTFSSTGDGSFTLAAGGEIEANGSVIIDHVGALAFSGAVTGASVTLETDDTSANAVQAVTADAVITANTGDLTINSAGGISFGLGQLLADDGAVLLTSGNQAVVVGVVNAGTTFSSSGGGTFSTTAGNSIEANDIDWNHAGLITINTSVTAAASITLQAGDGVTESGTGSLTADELLLLGSGTFDLGLNNSINTLAADVDGALILNNDGALTVGSIGAVDGINTTGNNVTLTTDGALSIGTGAGQMITAAGAQVTLDVATGGITADADSGVVTGSLLLLGNGDFLLAGPNDVDILAADITGNLTFQNDTALQVGTVGTVDGISTQGGNTLLETGGNLAINQAIDLDGGNLMLDVTGTVTQAAAGVLTASELALLGAGSVTLQNSSNSVQTLTGNYDGEIAFTNAGDLDVGPLSTSDDNVSLEVVSGDLTFIDAVNLGTGNLTLDVNGDVSQLNTGVLTANQFELLGSGSVDLTAAANLVTTLTANYDGTIAFTNASDLNVGPITTSDDDVTLNVQSGNLQLEDAVALGAGDLTLNVNGNVTQLNTGIITANGLRLLGSGAVDLTTADNNVSTFAADYDGNVAYYDVDGLEVGTVTDNTAAVASETTGADVTGTLSLHVVAGNLTQTANGDITASGLELLGGGVGTSVVLTNTGNSIDTLAADYAGTIAYQNAGGFSVGTVNTTSGIATSNSDVSLQAGDDVAINEAITLGTGSLTLNVTGDVTQSGTGVITADGLRLLGSGSITLTNGSNDINTLAADYDGRIAFTDADGLVVGEVTDNTLALPSTTTGLSSNGGDVLLTVTANDLSLTEAVDVGAGNLTLVVSNGSITQTAALTANGLQLLGGGGSIQLSNTANDVNTLAVDYTGDVHVAAADGLVIGTVNDAASATSTSGATASGTLVLEVLAGTVTQSAAIDAAGLCLLGGGSVTLNHLDNAVSTLAADYEGPIAFTNSVALQVGTLAGTTGITTSGEDVRLQVLSGNLAINDAVSLGATAATAGHLTLLVDNGSISQTAAMLAHGLRIQGAGGTVTLTNAANDVMTFAADFDGAISYVDANALTIGTVTDGPSSTSTAGINTHGQNLSLTTGGLLTIGTGNGESITASGALVLLDVAADGITEAADSIITAQSLAITGAGTFLLNQDNAVSQFAADVEGDLTFHAAGALDITTVNGVVGITTGQPADGGSVTIVAVGNLTVSESINTSDGTGGSISISGATIDAALIAGAGNISLTGGGDDLIINVDQSVATTLTLSANRDVIINAVVQTTTATADLIVTADLDNDGVGGVWVQTAGQLDAGGDLTLSGSDLFATVGVVDSILIDADGANDQLLAGGEILLQHRGNAPANADIIINGHITSTGGGVTIDAAHEIHVQSQIAALGLVEFADAVVLTGDLLITSDGDVTFASTVNDDGNAGTSSNLTVTAVGTTLFGSTVGNAAAITQLMVNGGGVTELCGSVATVNGQTYTDAVVLCADVVLTSTNSGDITFASTIDSDTVSPRALTVTTDGDTIFNGAVGQTEALASLTTNGGGLTEINGGLVRTTGFQLYSDNVTLGADTQLTSTAATTTGANITVSGTVGTNGHDLTVDAGTQGNVTFSDAVSGGGAFTITRGAVQQYAAITVDEFTIQSATTSVTLGGPVATTGAVSITSGGSLTQQSTVTAGTQITYIAVGAIDLQDTVTATTGTLQITSSASTIQAAQALTAATGLTLSSSTGTTLAAAADVTTTAANGNVSITGPLFTAADISTDQGTITFTGPVTLTGDVVWDSDRNENGGAAIFVDGTVNLAGFDLTLDGGTDGNITFQQAVSNGGQLLIEQGDAVLFVTTLGVSHLIVQQASTSITLNGNVTATGNVQLNSSGTIAQNAAVTAGDSADYVATGNLSVAGTLTATNEVDLLSTTGNIDLTGPVTATNGTLTATAGDNLTATAALQAGIDVLLTSTNGFTNVSGSIDAGQDVIVNAGTSISLDDEVTADRHVTLTAGTDIDLTGPVTATNGTLTATAADNIIATAALQAGVDVLLTSTNGFTDISGSITAVENVTIIAGTDIDLTGPVTATNGTLTATAGDNLTATAALQAGVDVLLTSMNGFTDVSGSITADENVTVIAGTDIDLTGQVTATNGTLTATAADNITATAALQAGVDVLLTSTNGFTNVSGTIDAGQDVIVNAGMSISLSDEVTADRHVTLAAGTDIDLTGSVTATNGTLTATAADNITATAALQAGVDVLLTSTNGFTDISGSITADENVTIIAGTDIDLTGPVTATNGTLTATAADNITATAALQAGVDVLLTSTNGFTDVSGTIEAGQDVIVNAGTSISLSDEVTANRHVTLTAGTNIDLTGPVTATNGTLTATAADNITATAALQVGVDVLLTSTNGFTNVTNTIDAGQDVIVNAGTSISLSDEVTADRHVTLTAGTDIDLTGPVTATNGTLTATAGDNITATAALQAGVDVLLTSTNGFTDISGSITAVENVTIIAGTDIDLTGPVTATNGTLTATAADNITATAALRAGVDVLLTSTNGFTNVSNTIDAGQDVIVNAGTSISLSDEVTANRHVSLTAGTDINLTAPVTATNGNLSATATAGSLSATDVLNAELDLTLFAGTFITLDDLVTAGNNIAMTAGSELSAQQTLTAGNGMTLVAGTTMTLAATADLFAGLGGVDITAADLLTAADVTTTGGDITITAAVQLTGDVTLDTSGLGNILIDGTVDATVPFGQSLFLPGGVGNITINGNVGSLQALNAIEIETAHDVTFGGAISADYLLQTAGTGTTTIVGAVNTFGAQGIQLTTSSIQFAAASSSMNSHGNPITLTADAITLPTTFTQALGSTVTLQTLSAGTSIGLEDATQQLNFTNTQLNTIHAENLIIGTADQTGGIKVGTDGAVSLDENLTLLTATTIEVFGPLSATAGNWLLLDAGTDIFVSGAITTLTGDLTLSADNDILLAGTAVIQTTSGNLLLLADADFDSNGSGGRIAMANGAVVNAGTGTLTLQADEDIVIGQLISNNATAAAITLTSNSGGIIDGGDAGGADVILLNPNGILTINAVQGVGSAPGFGANAAIETQVGQLQIINTQSGQIAIHEVDAITVLGIEQFGPGSVEMIAGGTLTVALGGPGVQSHGGDIVLTTTGAASNMVLNSAVESRGGQIALTVGNNLIQAATAPVLTSGGNFIGLVAGAVTMADGAIIETTQGSIQLQSGGNITLGQLITTNATANAVRLQSGGAIIDGGDTGGADIIANAAGAVVTIDAVNGVGSAPGFGSNAAIDTQIDSLILRNTVSGNVQLNEVDNLRILELTQSSAGSVTVNTVGNLLLVGGQPGVTATSGAVTLNATDAASSINIDSRVQTTSGQILVQAANNIQMGAAAQIISNTGNVTVRADADNSLNGVGGHFFMANGAVINAGSGTITARADGNITVGRLITTTTVSLTSTSAGIVDGGDAGGADITANALVMQTRTGIGSANPLETAVSIIAANNTTSGAIRIDNNTGGLLTIGTVLGVTGITNAGGNGAALLDVVNNGGITVNGAVRNSTGGNIQLTANANGGANDHLTVNAVIAATNGNGSVLLTAGDDLILNDTGAPVDVSVVNGGQILGTAGRDVIINDDVVVQSSTGVVTNTEPVLIDVLTPQLSALGIGQITMTVQRPLEVGTVIIIDWGDGVIETFVVTEPGQQTFTFTHQYLGPPDPANPAADIPLKVTVHNPAFTSGASPSPVPGTTQVANAAYVPNIRFAANGDILGPTDIGELNQTIFTGLFTTPGDGLASFVFDLTPPVQYLDFPQPTVIDASLLAVPQPPAQSNVVDDIAARTDDFAADERVVILEVIGPDGKLLETVVLPEDVLDDIDGVVRKLPDGRYRFLLREPGEAQLRLLQDVQIREGRISDDADSATDRPRSLRNQRLDRDQLLMPGNSPGAVNNPADSIPPADASRPENQQNAEPNESAATGSDDTEPALSWRSQRAWRRAQVWTSASDPTDVASDAAQPESTALSATDADEAATAAIAGLSVPAVLHHTRTAFRKTSRLWQRFAGRDV